MSDNSDKIVRMMKDFGLSDAESTIYIELLNGPTTHLKLSRATNITRSRVYHIVDLLEKKALAVRYNDDTGSFIKASDPNNLEIDLTAEEERLKGRRELLEKLIPALHVMQNTDEGMFSVKTYEGEAGFRQMAWHELKAKTDLLCFGYARVETLINDPRWAELHRQMTFDKGYKVREILNDVTEITKFTKNEGYLKNYECRSIPKAELPLHNQLVIFNNNVHVYHWRDGKQIGVTINSDSYAQTMRAIFEQFWKIAKPVEFIN